MEAKTLNLIFPFLNSLKINTYNTTAYGNGSGCNKISHEIYSLEIHLDQLKRKNNRKKNIDLEFNICIGLKIVCFHGIQSAYAFSAQST